MNHMTQVLYYCSHQAEDAHAHLLRDEIMKVLGPPGSYIRPEGNAVWVALGVIAALTFTLLGWL